MDFTQASREIKAGKTAPVYLIYGRETHLKDRLVSALKEKLVPGVLAALNQSVVDLANEPLERALELARTLPFLAENRLILVKGAKLDTTAEETGLLSYVDRPSPTTCLVFLAGETVDTRKKVAKAIDKLGGLIHCPEVKEWEMTRWIRRRAEEMGLRIPEPAAATLASMIPNDLELVERELEKLLIYTGGRSSITREDVEKVASGSTRVNIFKLTGALGARKRGEALAALEALLRDGEAPPLIVYMIARQVRLILSARVLREQGCPSERIQSRLGINPYAARECLAQAPRFGREELVRALEKLLEADLALKSGAMDASVALQLLVLEIASGC